VGKRDLFGSSDMMQKTGVALARGTDPDVTRFDRDVGAAHAISYERAGCPPRVELWRRGGQILDDVGEHIPDRRAKRGQDDDDTADCQDTHDQQN
jgi:hypothetical protein